MVVREPSQMHLFEGKLFHAVYIRFGDTISDVGQFIKQIPESPKPQTLVIYDAGVKNNLSAENINSILLLNVGSIEIFSSDRKYDGFLSEIDSELWIAKSIHKTTAGTYNCLTVVKNSGGTKVTPVERSVNNSDNLGPYEGNKDASANVDVPCSEFIPRGNGFDDEIEMFLSPKLKMSFPSQEEDEAIYKQYSDQALSILLKNSFIANRGDDGHLIDLSNADR